MSKPTGEKFRTIASYGVDTVAKFLAEFPDVYCSLKITTNFGDIIIALQDNYSSDTGPGPEETDAGQ